MSYQVKLEIFEGPLDLLLHLIKKHEVDIFDIPISFITKQYLEYLELMKTLNLEVAGEFLVMAATLVKIKSRMLLPRDESPEDEEEGEDPRVELVRRLLEYRQFKEAAGRLGDRELQWRGVFYRTEPIPSTAADVGTEPPSLEVSLFDLMDALQGVLARLPDQRVREITLERITVSEKSTLILERLEQGKSIGFTSLFQDDATHLAVIVTFLALLELVRLRLVRVLQGEAFGGIRIFRIPQEVEA